MSKLSLPTSPTLGDIQQYVTLMEKERGFSDEDVVSQCLLLVEEVGELCKAVRKSHTSMGVDVNKNYTFDTEGEVADILIMLTAVSNRLGINIEQAFRNKEEENKKRTWK